MPTTPFEEEVISTAGTVTAPSGAAGRSNLALRLFQVALAGGFAVNMIFIYRAFFDPEALLTPLGLPPSAADVWLGNGANLMLTVSIFYIPVIIDPTRYPAYSWLTALMRFSGVLFWLHAMQTNPNFRSYLIADLTLGIVQSGLLLVALRRRSGKYAQ